jgi:hypothetical protein
VALQLMPEYSWESTEWPVLSLDQLNHYPQQSFACHQNLRLTLDATKNKIPNATLLFDRAHLFGTTLYAHVWSSNKGSDLNIP